MRSGDSMSKGMSFLSNIHRSLAIQGFVVALFFTLIMR